MAITRSDQNELVLPLFEGLLSAAPWDIFLTRLLARTGADRAVLLRRDGHHRVVASGWAAPAAEELAALGGPPAALRLNRVYALEELRNVDSNEAREAEEAALAAARIGDARLIRIGTRDDSTWLILLAERGVFSAAASALLTSLAPAVEIAAEQLGAVAALRCRAEAAEGSLALLGIGQAVLGPDGEIIVSDPLWQSRQPALPKLAQPALAPGARAVTRAADGTALLLRALDGESASVATFRLPRREPPQSAARVLAATLGLSPREASLAALLSQGLSLVEAGRTLSLTDETTRNYSKRIYAKTGASGQADLTRIVLTGLATLG